jgi:hypothetical protein
MKNNKSILLVLFLCNIYYISQASSVAARRSVLGLQGLQRIILSDIGAYSSPYMAGGLYNSSSSPQYSQQKRTLL